MQAIGFFALALLARLSFYPWFSKLTLIGDEAYYWQQAARPMFSEQLRPPLWPALLSFVRSDDPVDGRLLAVVVGSLTVVLIMLLARRLHGPRVGVAAGVIAAFYPDHVLFSHLLWSEGLFGLLAVATTLVFLPRYNGEPLRLAAAGLLAGLAFLTRQFGVVLAAAGVVMILVTRAEVSWRRAGVAIGLFVLPFCLYWASIPQGTGKLGIPYVTHAAVNLKVGVVNTQDATVSQVAATMKEKGVAFAVERARNNLKRLWGSQSYATWRHKERLPRTALAAFVLSHALIVVFGVIGLMTDPNRYFRSFGLTCVLMLTAFAVPAYMVSRFRAPFMFLLIIEAARLLFHPTALTSLRETRWRLAGGVVVAGMLGVLMWHTRWETDPFY